MSLTNTPATVKASAGGRPPGRGGRRARLKALESERDFSGAPAYIERKIPYYDFLDDRGYPAVKPPWGTLNAIDLNTGKRRWQVTLGEYAELSKEGIPPTGTRNYGGPIVTAGGLVFVASTADEKIRAFDKKTGALLWDYQLPAAGYATPSTYQIGGKQYVVIVCSGGKLGTKAGDQYIAFALP